MANPILGEKDIDIKTSDVKILKYGSGLLFQLPRSNKVQKELLVKHQLDNKDKVNKLSKAEKEEKKLDQKESWLAAF